ncbi:DotH/IcmK family type IV secretion protein, partial [Acinetobacter baumannii]|nr:DotH/IcmK family type IV secretion protein [Acinetobacter baumannii]
MKIRLLVALIASLVTAGLSAEESKSDIAEILPATSMSDVNNNGKNENVDKQDITKRSGHNSPTETTPIESVAQLPPLPDDLQSLVEPISPDEIRAIKQKLGAVESAVNEVQYSPVPKISSQTVSLSAGSAIPQVRIYK